MKFRNHDMTAAPEVGDLVTVTLHNGKVYSKYEIANLYSDGSMLITTKDTAANENNLHVEHEDILEVVYEGKAY